MKCLTLMLLSALTTYPLSARADSGWSIQHLLLSDDGRSAIFWQGVNMLDGGKLGIAVGGRDGPFFNQPLVVTTDDGGRHWTGGLLPPDGRCCLSNVEFVDQTTAIAVGDRIYRTIDRGATWTVVNVQSARGLSFEDANAGTAVGDRGAILRTTDGGVTWMAQSSGTSNNLYDVSSFDTDSAVAVGDRGTVLRTIDGGLTWMFQSSGTKNSLRAVSFANASTGIIVGNGGIILRSTDGGYTWAPEASGTSANLLSVAYVDDGKTAIVGGFGIILRTIDGGTTWMQQELPPAFSAASWAGISVKDGNGVAVGYQSAAIILHTATQGEPVTCTTRAPGKEKAP